MAGRAPLRIAALSCALALAPRAGVARAADDYKLGPDSFAKEGVPTGTVTQHVFSASKIFPGTTRQYWVYVPAQYKHEIPACVMVFQDGARAVALDGTFRAPVVFDNLIHAKAMPITVGVFVDPGVVPAASPDALPRFNRSVEYDGLGEEYSRFLLEELLPEVGKKVNLTQDPNCRAIGGSSSGAIAAFTVAWHRPDAFRRVFSTIGTYVGLRGGDVYPTLLRKTEPKPLRIYLQDGSNDNNRYGGNWWVANQDMLSALEFAGYEVEHAWGDGGHTGKHGGAVLPEALRWLWKDYTGAINSGARSQQPVMEVLSREHGWQLVSEGHQFTEGPTATAGGELYFSDVKAGRIHKVGRDGKVSVFVRDSGGANGLALGPDGRLYAAQSGRKRIVAYDADGDESVIAEGIAGNDLTVSHRGYIWVTEHTDKRIWVVTPRGEKRVVDTGITFPNGVALTPDQTFLQVADTRGRFIYSFQVLPDGGLGNKQAFCHLHVPDDKPDSGADGLTVDTAGRLYVATHLGLQFCDQAGRVNGIIAKPQRKWLSNVTIGGPQMDELYVTTADRVYKRKVKAKGVLPAEAPIRPPAPKL